MHAIYFSGIRLQGVTNPKTIMCTIFLFEQLSTIAGIGTWIPEGIYELYVPNVGS
jgi:hypothetical protein